MFSATTIVFRHRDGRTLETVRRIAIVFFTAVITAAAADDTLVFSYFMKNGEDGLYLAHSTDGLRWKTLNRGKPLLRPEVGESKLMRDPSITRGPDGTFHMVWTTSWQGRTIGYSSSKDLVRWSAQRAIDVMPGTEVLNCWAPEIFYDEKGKDFVIVWASTIKGKFPQTLGTAGKEYNHRLYVTRTRDFRTMSPAKLFYDPGFIVIDGALFRTNDKYALVVKNETESPPAKYLFLTYASSLDGPWSLPGKSVSGPDWAEGASPVQIRGEWYIYFDKYRNKRYGAIRSKDLENWEDISALIAMPEGARHGTVFRAPAPIVDKLR